MTLPDGDPKITFTVAYDDEYGEVRTMSSGVFEDAVHESIKVRARLQEQVLRTAVVAELTRLGYIVIPPEEAL